MTNPNVPKKAIKSVNAARKGGSLDVAIMKADALDAIAQIEAGHYSILDAGEINVGSKDVVLWFLRHEN